MVGNQDQMKISGPSVYNLLRFPHLWKKRAGWHDSCLAQLCRNMLNGKHKLTVVSDVEATSWHWVVSLKFQPQNMTVASKMGGHLSPSEGSKNRGVWRVTVFNSKEIKLRFQIKVIKRKVYPTSWVRDYCPDAVQIVSISFWVIRRKDRSHWRSEVREARDCEKKIIK